MRTGWAPIASASSARTATRGSSPSMATVAPRSASSAASVSAKATMGWKLAASVPAAMAGWSTVEASRPPRRHDRASGRPDRRPRCRCSGTHRGRPRPRAAHGDGDARVASPGGRDPAYRGPRPHGSRGYGRWSGVYCDEHQSTLDPRRAHPSGADPARSVRDRGPGGPTSMTRLLSTGNDPFGARSRFAAGDRSLTLYRLDRAGVADLGRLPLTVKVLLENLLRNAGDGVVAEADARALAGWRPGAGIDAELPFLPSRVILQAFTDLRAVPPGTGIVHQVNLEYLATVVMARADAAGETVAYPDTLVGTDSHTTMVNGLGVLGYGVGGIEAEAVLLGQPLYQPMPKVVGVRLHGELPLGSTATDLVLVVTEMLRAHGVVGAFVEFAGDGLAGLALADRATIANMSPEFGATAALFPIDDETLTYLRLTGREGAHLALVEAYAKEQGLWREPGPGPEFDETLELDLATVRPSLAGPRRPHGDGRRRAAGPQRRGPRPARGTDREDESRPRLEGGDPLPRARRADGAPRGARLRAGRLRLHDLHRQLRPPRRADRAGHRGARPRRGGRAPRPPQLRGPHPSLRPRHLPGEPAARGRLRPRRADRHRPDPRAAGHHGRRPAGDAGRHLAVARRGPGDDRRGRHARVVPRDLRRRLRGRRALARPARADRRPLCLGSRVDLHRQPAVLRPSRPS